MHENVVKQMAARYGCDTVTGTLGDRFREVEMSQGVRTLIEITGTGVFRFCGCIQHPKGDKSSFETCG